MIRLSHTLCPLPLSRKAVSGAECFSGFRRSPPKCCLQRARRRMSRARSRSGDPALPGSAACRGYHRSKAPCHGREKPCPRLWRAPRRRGKRPGPEAVCPRDHRPSGDRAPSFSSFPFLSLFPFPSSFPLSPPRCFPLPAGSRSPPERDPCSPHCSPLRIFRCP